MSNVDVYDEFEALIKWTNSNRIKYNDKRRSIMNTESEVVSEHSENHSKSIITRSSYSSMC